MKSIGDGLETHGLEKIKNFQSRWQAVSGGATPGHGRANALAEIPPPWQ